MATGDEQPDDRIGQGTVLQFVHDHVTGEVVDAVHGDAERHRQRLGGGRPDQQRSHQSRSGRHSDRVDVTERDAGGRAGAHQRRLDRLEVRAAGHFGHDPAEAGMLIDTRGDLVGQQLGATHDADAGLVAGRLDAQHDRITQAPVHGASGRFARAARRRMIASLPSA